MYSSLSGISRNMTYITIAYHSAWLASVSLWYWAFGLHRALARMKWLGNMNILTKWQMSLNVKCCDVLIKSCQEDAVPGTPHYSEKQ